MADDAVRVLEDDHGSLKVLFERVSSPDEDRPKVLKDLMTTLAGHLDMEKEILVPALRDRVEDGDAMADTIIADHDRTEEILTLLDRRKVNSPDVPGLVTELLDINDRHVAHADETVLPGLRATFDAGELSELGERMTSDERRLLTHPHPGLPDSGPLAGVTRRVAEVVDRLRDDSTDIGRTNS